MLADERLLVTVQFYLPSVWEFMYIHKYKNVSRYATSNVVLMVERAELLKM